MKKNLFFPSFSLLAFAALLIFASCRDTNEALRAQIRAEVEKEFMTKMKPLFQMPQNYISEKNIQVVAENLKKIDLKVGQNIGLGQIGDTKYSCFMDKDMKFTVFGENNGIKQEQLMRVALDLRFDPRIASVLRERIPGYGKLPTLIDIDIEKIGICLGNAEQYCLFVNDDSLKNKCIGDYHLNNCIPKGILK